MTQDYWRWIAAVAVDLRSDGCSGPATNAYLPCCYEHDVQYATGKDARHAYRLWRESAGTISFPTALALAAPITREQADKDLKYCIQARSVLGRWSLFAWARYLVLAKWKRGQKAWDQHRAREAQ